MRAPVHVTVWGGGRRRSARAVLVHGTLTWGTDEYGFAAQRPLADVAELVVIDRRGFGASPDVDRSDYEVDAADLAELVGPGAHVVGHSYGAVVAMLAAAMRPDRVRSLTLIEPSAHRAAAGDPVVAAALARMRAAVARAAHDDGAGVACGLHRSRRDGALCPNACAPAFRGDGHAGATMLGGGRATRRGRGRTVSEARDLGDMGGGAPAAYRATAGDALMACARVVAEALDADTLRVAGASHWPHAEQPEVVNAALRRLWRSAAG